MTLKEDIKNEIVGRLKQALSPAAIYLFGSYAYGTPGIHSDIDIFIVLNNNDTHLRKKISEAYKAMRGTTIPVEFKTATLDEFTKRSTWVSSIERVVTQKGVILYDANK
jgi:predicted nucleotidyltransferase